MKVYLVFSESHFGDDVEIVFKNKNDAEHFIEECGDGFYIEEHEVIE